MATGLRKLLQAHLQLDVVMVVFLFVDKNYYRQFGEFRYWRRPIHFVGNLNLEVPLEQKQLLLQPLDPRTKHLVWNNHIVQWKPDSGRVDLLAMDHQFGEDRSLVLRQGIADLRVAPDGLHIVFFARHLKFRWILGE